MSHREPKSIELDGLTIESRPLPYTNAEDIQPDVYGLLVKVVKRLVDTMGVAGVQRLAAVASDENATGPQVAAMLIAALPALETLFDQLRGGELKRLAPLVLASTTVVMANPDTGKKERYELSKLQGRSDVFDEHPSIYWVAIFHAGRTTFARFFPGAGLAGLLASAANTNPSPAA